MVLEGLYILDLLHSPSINVPRVVDQHVHMPVDIPCLFCLLIQHLLRFGDVELEHCRAGFL